MDPPPWSGVWLAEDIELIAQGVRDRSWVEGSVGAVSVGLDAREMTEAERRWESWYDAYLRVIAELPEPVEVPCPEGDGGRIHLTYHAFPGSRVGSATVWCEVGRNGIFLDRVGIPAGAEVIPFDEVPDDREDIALIPTSMYTRED